MIAGTVAIVFVMAAFACLFRMRRYRGWFRLPAQRTDGLSCRGNHRTYRLIVEPKGFDLANGLNLQGRTVFLQITVKVLPLGRLFDPFIEIQEGQKTHRQYFERGVTGQRYLNLTPLFVRRSGEGPLLRVGLRGSSMRWDAEASLLVFDAPAIEGARVLVLA